MPNPKPRTTHSQITAGLREFATQQGLAANDVYSRFFREIFLGELMNTDPVWVLKGGTNLYCFIPGARHTQDLDLYRQSSPTGHRDAADTLIAVMNRTKVGRILIGNTPDLVLLFKQAHTPLGVAKLTRFGTV
ncbi:hypothetical protein [Rhodococcus qingshengii]